MSTKIEQFKNLYNQIIRRRGYIKLIYRMENGRIKTTEIDLREPISFFDSYIVLNMWFGSVRVEEKNIISIE